MGSLIPLGFWAASGAGSGGGGTGVPAYELISTTVLSTTASSVTFTDSGTWSAYKHLQLRMTLRTNRSANADNLSLRFNGDTGSNYQAHALYGDSTGVYSGAYLSQTFIYVATTAASTSPTGTFSTEIVDILDAFNTSKFKTIRGLDGLSGGTSDWYVGLWSGNWRSTAAITSITGTSTTGSLVTGSRISLYGIKG